MTYVFQTLFPDSLRVVKLTLERAIDVEAVDVARKGHHSLSVCIICTDVHIIVTLVAEFVADAISLLLCRP